MLWGPCVCGQIVAAKGLYVIKYKQLGWFSWTSTNSSTLNYLIHFTNLFLNVFCRNVNALK